MKTDDLLGWKAFIAVAQFESFAQAAKALNLPVSAVSKRVAALEEQLCVRLFQRTTRVVRLTDEGRSVLPKIKELVSNLSEIENTFSEKTELSGLVKVTCVPFVAHSLLIPALQKFNRMHPKVKIELSLSEKIESLIDSGFDMAIRIQTPEDTDLIYKKLAPNDLIFSATPKYLKNKPQIKTPEDLQNHDLLLLRIHEKCKFQNSELALKKFSSRKSIESDSGAFLTDLALNDFGILVRSIWDVKNHLEKGTLVQVLRKHPLETFGHIHAVIPNKKYLSPRARAFYEFIVLEAHKIFSSK